MAAASTPLLAWIPGFTTWLTIWVVLAVATVVLVVLLRTRWREAKTWKKCALLSLWVHVLLACLAANVRIGVGGPGMGPGSGGPIRVAIVSVPPTVIAAEVSVGAAPETAPESVAEPEAESVEAKPEAEIAESPAPAAEPRPVETPAPKFVAPREDSVVIARDAAPALPTPDVALEPPALLPKPAPEPPPSEAAEDNASDDAVLVEAKRQADATSSEEKPPTEALADKGAASELPLEKVSTVNAGPSGTSVDPSAQPRSGVPALYANRFADHDALVSGGGGDPTTERAVRAALAWLAAAQERDGHWDPKRHGAGQERFVLGENRGAAGGQADTGITALALLAFMGAGHTHRDGPYADNVARGLDYLRRSQGPNGNLGGRAELFAHMYCHSMATFAVSEACAMTGDAKLRPVVTRAVEYSLAAQHPTDGGWRYRSGDTGDTSQLGWQLMALRSAELAGVEVPPATWTRVNHFLSNVERGAAGGLAAYRPEGPPSRAMTAEALFCRQLLTHRGNGALSPAAFDEARRAMLEERPGGVVVNFYYWYYATIALHRAQHETPAAAEAWKAWNDALTRALVGTQSGDGSWSSACLWGGYGGRVYTTSLAAMSLEVYYRYADDGVPPNVARRDEWERTPAR